MEFRTRITIEKSKFRITYSDPVLFIGSCFASEIGSKLDEGKLPVLVNPSGTVYNPVSVINTLKTITSGKHLTIDDLFCHDGTWLSFSHYTDFSSSDPAQVLDKINRRTETASEFLRKAKFLFVTFGTARVYRLKKSGAVVSNCHKLPASFFNQELLNTAEIVNMWKDQLDLLQSAYPGIKVIFTVSPVRHWKDGAHGNQVSKSVLFLAIEELLNHPSSPGYFPAYEILMDELRDYRFYNEDMLHPSQTAVDYIWEAFSSCYLDESTSKTWNEAAKITRAAKHRISSGNTEKIREFAINMLTRISKLESSIKEINFSTEKEYFESLADK